MLLDSMYIVLLAFMCTNGYVDVSVILWRDCLPHYWMYLSINQSIIKMSDKHRIGWHKEYWYNNSRTRMALEAVSTKECP